MLQSPALSKVLRRQGEDLMLALKSQLNTRRGENPRPQSPTLGLLTLAEKQRQVQPLSFSLASKVGQAVQRLSAGAFKRHQPQGWSVGVFLAAATPVAPPHRSTHCTPQHGFGCLFPQPSSNPKHAFFPWMGADQAAHQGLCSSLLQ